MCIALYPLVAFVMSAPAPADQHVAAESVAAALADADRIVRVHEAPGAIVFDLDRGGELFQLTVALDDDGRVTASAVDWAGPTGKVAGGAPAALANLTAVDQIDLDASRRVILRGNGADVTLAVVARG